MRTFDEIKVDEQRAHVAQDVASLQACAAEWLALDTPHARAAAFNTLGTVAKLTGDYPSALEHYRRAIAVHEELGNRAGVAGVTGNMGNVYSDTGDYTSALEHCLRALAVHEELNNRAGVALITGNMGNVFRHAGDYPSALEHYRRALAVHEEQGDRAGVARVTGNMGNVYSDTGDYPSALEHFQNSLALAEEMGDRAVVASVLGNLGGVYFRTGDYPSAREHFLRALALHETVGDNAGLALVTGNIGSVFGLTGDYSAALEYYGRALTMHEELGDRANVVNTIGNMITALMELERYDEAAELLERQSAMLMDHPRARAYHHANRAMLAEHLEDLNAAHGHLMKALSITSEASLRAQSASLHQQLRDLAQKRNDFAGFIEHNAEYLRITEEIRGIEATQRLAMMQAERKAEAVERERQKERSLLYGALPRSIADRMIRSEDVSGDHFDHAAVMFLDIVGFTSNTSTMPPAEVVKLLEHIFITIDGICDTHNVVKIKTIGDSYMCFRGDADATTNAQSIANVGIEVMKGAFTWPSGAALIFRSGIHIGPATAGVIGTQRLQYDVWGDTVNVASRMESSGEAGRIHVSEAFAKSFLLNDSMTNGSMTLLERGVTDIKGKGPMTTYWLEYAR